MLRKFNELNEQTKAVENEYQLANKAHSELARNIQLHHRNDREAYLAYVELARAAMKVVGYENVPANCGYDLGYNSCPYCRAGDSHYEAIEIKEVDNEVREDAINKANKIKNKIHDEIETLSLLEKQKEELTSQMQQAIQQLDECCVAAYHALDFADEELLELFFNEDAQLFAMLCRVYCCLPAERDKLDDIISYNKSNDSRLVLNAFTLPALQPLANKLRSLKGPVHEAQRNKYGKKNILFKTPLSEVNTGAYAELFKHASHVEFRCPMTEETASSFSEAARQAGAEFKVRQVKIVQRFDATLPEVIKRVACNGVTEITVLIDNSDPTVTSAVFTQLATVSLNLKFHFRGNLGAPIARAYFESLKLSTADQQQPHHVPIGDIERWSIFESIVDFHNIHSKLKRNPSYPDLVKAIKLSWYVAGESIELPNKLSFTKGYATGDAVAAANQKFTRSSNLPALTKYLIEELRQVFVNNVCHMTNESNLNDYWYCLQLLFDPQDPRKAEILIQALELPNFQTLCMTKSGCSTSDHYQYALRFKIKLKEFQRGSYSNYTLFEAFEVLEKMRACPEQFSEAYLSKRQQDLENIINKFLMDIQATTPNTLNEIIKFKSLAEKTISGAREDGNENIVTTICAVLASNIVKVISQPKVDVDVLENYMDVVISVMKEGSVPPSNVQFYTAVCELFERYIPVRHALLTVREAQIENDMTLILAKIPAGTMEARKAQDLILDYFKQRVRVLTQYHDQMKIMEKNARVSTNLQDLLDVVQQATLGNWATVVGIFKTSQNPAVERKSIVEQMTRVLQLLPTPILPSAPPIDEKPARMASSASAVSDVIVPSAPPLDEKNDEIPVRQFTGIEDLIKKLATLNVDAEKLSDLKKDFCDPVNHQIMLDPWLTKRCITFDRASFLNGHYQNCPITRENNPELVLPNLDRRNAIMAYLEEKIAQVEKQKAAIEKAAEASVSTTTVAAQPAESTSTLAEANHLLIFPAAPVEEPRRPEPQKEKIPVALLS